MPMIAFFPWITLDDSIEIGRFRLIPIDPSLSWPSEVQCSVSPSSIIKILSKYRQSSKLAIEKAVVVQVDEKPLGGEFDESTRSALFRLRTNLAVCGLSGRRFGAGGLDNYCASGHFQLLIQSFAEPYLGGVSVSYRRKHGRTNLYWGQQDIQFTIPAHLVNPINASKVDHVLLAALEAAQDTQQDQIRASITQFLLSSSDSPDVPEDVELVAAYSAFERLIGSHALTKVKNGVVALLGFMHESNAVAQARLTYPDADNSHISFASWLVELHNVRGRLAHGNSADGYLSKWNPFEHGLLAAYAYPFLLKAYLAQQGLYEINQSDAFHVLAFSKLFSSIPLLRVAPQLSPGDSKLQTIDGWSAHLKEVEDLILRDLMTSSINESYERLFADPNPNK